MRGVGRRSCVSGLLLLVACGGEDLFIAANVDRGESCDYAPDLDNAVARAEFDLAEGASEGSTACVRPFLAHLVVENPNSETALVESAEIKLTDIQRRTIIFNRRETALPNPFLITIGSSVARETSGVVAIEAIPVDYAEQLHQFAGRDLVVQAHLYGTTSAGSEIESNVFNVQVALCEGCRTFCASDPASEDVGECSGRDLGAEREFCIDDSC